MAAAVAGRALLLTVLVGALFVGCGGSDERAPEIASGPETTTTRGPASAIAPHGPPTSNGAAPENGTGVGPGPCRALPDPGPVVDWLPEGLTLPEGAYLVERPVGDESFQSGTLAVPMAYGEFMEFALTEWPSHGWETVQTYVKYGDGEATFSRGDDEWGTFEVRLAYCEPSWSEVVLSVGTY